MMEMYDLFVCDPHLRYGIWLRCKNFKYAIREARYLNRAFCIERSSDHARLAQSVSYNDREFSDHATR